MTMIINKCWTYVFLSEINKVLQVDVIPIGPDVVIDEQV